ncbi:hypothetical protein, partial [Kocuria atrinae]|uniref:hypothetical protein n=1 Tax=Kocuria atrinae TaxID=592377 RepID=UPI0031DD116C
MTLEDWANVATVVAGMGAIIAAAIAVVAIIQARRLQDEKSQPYVVAVMESNPHMPEMLELAFRNVGETAAHDVEVSIDPAPQRAPWNGGDELKDLQLPEVMPVLVPGQEWRTTWDSARFRHDAELPSRHTATISYTGLGVRGSAGRSGSSGRSSVPTVAGPGL